MFPGAGQLLGPVGTKWLVQVRPTCERSCSVPRPERRMDRSLSQSDPTDESPSLFCRVCLALCGLLERHGERAGDECGAEGEP